MSNRAKARLAFGAQVQAARTARKMSRTAAANACKVDVVEMKQIEDGGTFALSTAYAVADYLEIDRTLAEACFAPDEDELPALRRAMRASRPIAELLRGRRRPS